MTRGTWNGLYPLAVICFTRIVTSHGQITYVSAPTVLTFSCLTPCGVGAFLSVYLFRHLSFQRTFPHPLTCEKRAGREKLGRICNLLPAIDRVLLARRPFLPPPSRLPPWKRGGGRDLPRRTFRVCFFGGTPNALASSLLSPDFPFNVPVRTSNVAFLAFSCSKLPPSCTKRPPTCTSPLLSGGLRTELRELNSPFRVHDLFFVFATLQQFSFQATFLIETGGAQRWIVLAEAQWKLSRLLQSQHRPPTASMCYLSRTTTELQLG